MDHDRYDPTRRYPPNRLLNMISGNASFPLLEYILDPICTPLLIQDAVLVSIDLESRVNTLGKRQITQLGTASLDTRILIDLDTDDSQSLVKAVQSRVFNICPKRASSKAWVPTSLWATPEKIGHDELCDKLNEIFFKLKSDCSTTDKGTRDIILVGHSISSDRSLLRELFDFDINRVVSIKAILDTGRMMCSGYDFGIATQSHFPLRMTLRYLGIPYDQLHDAGNDSMFTMKALLLMFYNWKSQKDRYLWNIAEESVFSAIPQSIAANLLWDRQLEVLSAIAREPWPVLKKPAPRRSTTHIQRVEIETDLLMAEDLDLNICLQLNENASQ